MVTGDLSEGRTEWTAGAVGAVVALDDGVVLRLGAGARLRWWPSSHLLLGGSSPTPADVLGLLDGAAVVEAPLPKAKAQHAVLVQLPGGLTGVTAGGRLEVATDGRSSAVANLEGTAWASPNGSSHVLDPGMGWSTSKVDVSPFPIAAAPVLTAARHAYSGISGGAAIDEHGLEGRPSAPLTLHVVGIALPQGATLDGDGAVTLADRAPVALTHATGLLVAYGSAREWGPAPPEVRLFRGEPTLVRIRDPRDATGFDLPLQPRRFVLRVSVGPKHLTWPGDAVHISIRATDGRGGAAPSTVELHPVVTLGVEPLPVEFARQGSSLVADVAAPADPGPGPWVVRVQVNDQFGNSIGRDFVEIARRPAPKKPPGGRPLPRI